MYNQSPPTVYRQYMDFLDLFLASFASDGDYIWINTCPLAFYFE